MQGVSRKGWGWLRECSSGEGSFAVRWAYFIVGMDGWLRGRSSEEESFAVRWAYFMVGMDGWLRGRSSGQEPLPYRRDNIPVN